jgi:hypothetical protein
MKRLPFGDEGAMCADGDWPEQCQSGAVVFGRDQSRTSWSRWGSALFRGFLR